MVDLYQCVAGGPVGGYYLIVGIFLLCFYLLFSHVLCLFFYK